jgi:hypothetical protein
VSALYAEVKDYDETIYHAEVKDYDVAENRVLVLKLDDNELLAFNAGVWTSVRITREVTE